MTSGVNRSAGETGTIMSNPCCPFDTLQVLKKIGHITPSSNTALEPITALMNASLADRVSHHFTRITVKQITLDSSTGGQFELAPMMAAAGLLADAALDAIVWNGTSGSWLGVEHDEELCRHITDRTGIPASTSTLAFHEAFRRFGFTRVALAVPYTADIRARISNVYAEHGFETASAACLGQTINIEFGNTRFDVIRQLLRDADSPQAECIAVVCTNLAATSLVEEMERELGKPIIDSIAVTFWKGCMLAGIEPKIEGWGALMRGTLTARQDQRANVGA
jgi:maleate isomerase